MRDVYGFQLNQDPPAEVLDRKAAIEMMQAGCLEWPPNPVVELGNGIWRVFNDYWFREYRDVAHEVIREGEHYWLFCDDECFGEFNSFSGMCCAMRDSRWAPGG